MQTLAHNKISSHEALEIKDLRGNVTCVKTLTAKGRY